MQMICDLHGRTIDQYGESEWANGERFHWWPHWSQDFIGANSKEIIHIGERAEEVLLDALIDAKPNLLSDEEKEEYQSNGFESEWASFKNK